MEMIWKLRPQIDQLNKSGESRMPGHLGIEFLEVGEDFLIAKMPVDQRTQQPFGLLHGGASVALAETLGSLASFYSIEPDSGKMPVGVEINANHLSSARNGYVFGKVEPIKVGRNMHVWQIRITDEKNKLICVSRLTVAIVDIR